MGRDHDHDGKLCFLDLLADLARDLEPVEAGHAPVKQEQVVGALRVVELRQGRLARLGEVDVEPG